MERRKFLIGAGALAAGGAAALGSGAFSSVEADRDVTVEVADDADAFLALEPGEENGEYAEETDGTLELNFDESADVDGEGFNRNAKTIINDVFRIQNQGTQDVKVTLEVAEDEEDLPGDIDVGEFERFIMLHEGDAGGPRSAFQVSVEGTDPEPVELETGGFAEAEVAFDGDEDITDGLEDVEFTLVINAEAT